MTRILVAFLVLVAVGCEGGRKEKTQNVTAKPSPSNSTIGENEEGLEEKSQLIDSNISDDQPYVSFPAVRIKMLRPVGFDDAEKFHGFQQENTQSSILLNRIPGPFSEIKRGFTSVHMETRGMNLLGKKDITIAGKNGILINITQSAYGIDFEKWVLVFEMDGETIMATATFPASETQSISENLKNALLSTLPDDSPEPPLGSDLDFKLVASKKLKITRSNVKALAFTQDGAIPMKSQDDPLLIATQSHSAVQIGDLRQFALKRLSQTALIITTQITSEGEIEIDGLSGYEIVADALHSDTARPVVVYQLILKLDDSYIIVGGRVGADSADEYLPEFKKMAHSLKRRTTPKK